MLRKRWEDRADLQRCTLRSCRRTVASETPLMSAVSYCQGEQRRSLRTEAHTLNRLNAETGDRVPRQLVDSMTGETAGRDQILKG
jgi:hypothetical protein